MRQWLTNNQIFFQLFQWVLVGAASVTVALLTYFTHERRLEMDRQLAGPHLKISRILSKNEATNKYEDDFLLIANEGRPVRELSSRVYAFLSINHGKKEIRQPVTYFFAQHSTGHSTGVVKYFRQPQNNSEMARIDRELQDIKTSDPILGELKVFISVQYKDLLGEKHNACYIVPQGEARELLPSICESAAADFNSKSLVDINKVTAKTLGF